METNTYTNNVNNDVVSTTFPTQKIKYLFEEVKFSDFEIRDFDVLSITQRGILSRDLSTNEGQIAASYENYIKVEVGDISLNPMDLLTGWVDINNKEGLMSAAYYTLRNKSSKVLSIEFAIYFFQMCYRQRIFFKIGKGVATHDGAGRWTLTRDNLMNFKFPVPKIHEQNLISKYLDEKTTQIDSLIEKIERKIELLQEQRIALINQAVTKGLDPTVEMKDSGIEWIGEIPKHWEIASLKFGAKILRGKFTHRPRNDPEFYDGEYPFIQTGDISAAGKYLTEFTQTLNERGHSVSKEFPVDTLVMGIAANIGNVSILKIKSCFPDSIVGFVPSKNSHTDFLYYLFGSMKFEFERNSVVSTQLNLNVERLGDIQIPLMPVQEQKLISNFLDTNLEIIDFVIVKETKRIELLGEQRTALINQAVTKGLDPNVEMKDSGVDWIGEIPSHWEVKRLKYFGNLITDKKTSSESDIRISPENVESYTGKISTLYTDYEGEGVVFKKGDILLNKLRIYLTKILLADYDGVSMGEMIVLRFNQAVESKYFYYVFFHVGLIQWWHSQSTGVKMPRVSPEIILNTSMPIPDFETQIKVSTHLNKITHSINSLISKETKRIELLKEYRQSLISNVVTGKVRVVEEVV